MSNVVPMASSRLSAENPMAYVGLMRVLIADDHILVRDTLALYLEGEGVSEVECVDSLDAAVEIADRTGSFDLVLLDYNMPGMHGLDGLQKMLQANDKRPVAIISGTASPQIAREAIESGAVGFLPKTIGADSMASAVRFMAAGETFVPYSFMQQIEAKTVADLTERETDVLRELCEGLSNKEIARNLGLQEPTIKLHVKSVCKKLGAKNRTQAAMIARDRRLI